MSSAERNDAIDRLSGNLQKTTSFFRKHTTEADKILRLSYQVHCNDELKAKFHTTLLHYPSSATSPSLLEIFLNTLRMFNAS